MRKRMIMLTIVFLAGAIGAAVMIGVLLHRERNVTMTVTTHYGDVSAADGLEITFREYPHFFDKDNDGLYYREDTRLNKRQWKNTITFSGGESTLTSEMFRETRDIHEQEGAYRDREEFLYKANGDVYGGGYGIVGRYIGNDFFEMLPESLLDSFKKSETPVTIRLSEYAEYYPMLNMLRVPNRYEDNFGEVREYKDGPLLPVGNEIRYPGYYDNAEEQEKEYTLEYRYDYSEVKAVARKFEEFFRIPVIPEDVRKLTVSRDSYSDYVSIEQEVAGEDFYEPRFTGSTTEEALYFTFNTHTEAGSVVDTSLIPGGYGIYRLPFRENETNHTTTILIDEMKVFVPLSPEADRVEVMIDNTQKTMMIYYTLNGVNRVQLIDLASGQCVYEADLGAVVAEDWFTFMDVGEDLFVLNLVPKGETGYNTYEERVVQRGKKSKMYVFGRNASGQYETVLDTNAFLEYMGGKYAFDGKRLAQAVIVYDDVMMVYVYSASGMDYRAEYRFSIGEAARVTEQGSESYYGGGYVEPWDLQCRWKN